MLLGEKEICEVPFDEPIYKVFVRSGLIGSNAEAKRLIKDQAIQVWHRDFKAIVDIDWTIEHLAIAAKVGCSLRIGKKFYEQLEFVEREGSGCE